MPFDAELVLFDGSVDIANTAATSLTRTLGHAVLDLKETAVKGLAIVIVVTGTSPVGACEFVPTVQCSDSLAFAGAGREDTPIGGAYSPSSISNYDIASGGVFVKRVSTDKRYMRVKITSVTNGSYFSTVYIMACPYPFKQL